MWDLTLEDLLFSTAATLVFVLVSNKYREHVSWKMGFMLILIGWSVIFLCIVLEWTLLARILLIVMAYGIAKETVIEIIRYMNFKKTE